MSDSNGSNTPPARFYASAVVAVVLIAGAVALAALSNPDAHPATGTVLGVILAAIPGAVAAVFAERAARDIRNGVIVQKVKEGASQAIVEHGVMTRTGPVASAQLEALTKLLQVNTNATQTNTAVMQQQAATGSTDPGVTP